MKTLDEVKPLRSHLTHEYHVKYAKSKNDPIKITKFATHDQAKEFLADVEKDGMKGIISWRGRPVKEEVELDEELLDHEELFDQRENIELLNSQQLNHGSRIIQAANSDKLSILMNHDQLHKEAIAELNMAVKELRKWVNDDLITIDKQLEVVPSKLRALTKRIEQLEKYNDDNT